MNVKTPGQHEYRAVFVSDTHLGAPGVQAERFLAFLRELSCGRLYLLGDIIDFQSLARCWHWEASHGEVLRELLGLVAKGTRVTYVPGNHDWFVRGFPSLDIGGIEVVREAIHEAADGKRYLVVHGDRFDRSGRIATLLSDVLVSALHAATRCTNRIRRAAALPYFPLGARLRSRIQHLVPHVARFEAAAAAAARDAGVDGTICGHLHIAALKAHGDVLYCNTGDWVDSCTALREDHSGRLSLHDAAAVAEPAVRPHRPFAAGVAPQMAG